MESSMKPACGRVDAMDGDEIMYDKDQATAD